MGREAAGPAGAAVLAEGLTKRFGTRTAYENVDFSVGYGEVFGFLGPNGAGKTSTVRTLGTLLAPSSGTASVAGLPLNPANAVEIRRRIAVMPESPGLYLRLSVAENLEFFAGLYELDDVRGRIARALRAVNLQDRADDTCRSLSKGLRQRVGLARALLSDPQVLFLDEPTSGLDPVAAREVHELIDGLRKRGVTIFLTTHRLAEAERLCDRVAIMNTTVRSIGRPDELREGLFRKGLRIRVAEPLADPAAVFAAVPGMQEWQQDTDTDADAEAEADGNADGGADGNAGGGADAGSGGCAYRLTVDDPEAAAPKAVRALVEAGADLLEIGPSRHSLEDVYLRLIDTDVEAETR